MSTLLLPQLLALAMLAGGGLLSGCATRGVPLADLHMSAWGKGLAPADGQYSASQRRIMAIRAAELDSVAALAILAAPPDDAPNAAVPPDLLSFFATWAEKDAPVEANGAFYVRATSSPPSHDAYALYLRAHAAQSLATLHGETTPRQSLLHGPHPAPLPAPTLDSIQELLARLSAPAPWSAPRRQHELLRIGRELGILDGN
jgi:hypothetical protein